MGGPVELKGPDLGAGVALGSIGDKLLGHADGEPVLVVRRGEELLAVGAVCTHYSGPLADGIVVGDTVRCPYHHACFDLHTGEASAPAFNPIPVYNVERRGDRCFVTGKKEPSVRTLAPGSLQQVVIIGGGAAGHSAAETLRREGYGGSVTLISADEAAPYDRPNVSKDYLAGGAPEEWMPMRPAEFYASHDIVLRLGQRVTAIDTTAHKVVLDGGDSVAYEALLLATGAEPVRLSVPGHDLPSVHTVRTLADSKAIIEKSKRARKVVVIGASFIGLEVAASMRARGLDVVVTAPDEPLIRVLGPQLSAFVRALHEEHGVVFHIGPVAAEITATEVVLSDGKRLPADLVLVGIGVRPSLALAEKAGLAVDRGVVVDRLLQTSVPGIFAAGDIARWPDAHTGASVRVEHWAVAQRQGAAAARNMLGRGKPFFEVPFFWSQHYDVPINYVGHAEKWDRIEQRGSLADSNKRECLFAFRDGGKITAIVTIGRDRDSLEAELAFETDDQAALETIVAR